jgi:pyridoxamine 5'-phosphate oxidase family protein
VTGSEGVPPGRSAFTAEEIAYLRSQRLARLATTDRSGHPQNSPVGLHYNAATDTIDINGWNLTASRKYRNVTAHPHVALVIDDMPVEGAPRGIEIRGQARALPAGDPANPGQSAIIRIRPHRIISWGLTRPGRAAENRAFPEGRNVR